MDSKTDLKTSHHLSRKITKTVWVEKKPFLEFCRGMRTFPFMLHPEKSEYVEDHHESFIEVEIPFDYKLGTKLSPCKIVTNTISVDKAKKLT